MVKIQVKHREIYGNSLMYVCDPQQAQIISQLTGKRTVDDKDVQCLRQLGIEVEDLDETLRTIFAK